MIIDDDDYRIIIIDETPADKSALLVRDGNSPLLLSQKNCPYWGGGTKHPGVKKIKHKKNKSSYRSNQVAEIV